MSDTFKRGNLLGLEGFSKEEISHILDTALEMRTIGERAIKKVPTLRGRLVVNFFFEPSTRTRSSFEVAAKRLSADTISLSASTSSLTKGETLIDTGKNLQAMAPDVIIIRHSMSGAPHLLARHVSASVINAGDGTHEHPTQALLDLMTMRDKKGGLQGLQVAIMGDIAHSRVARSNIIGLNTMGAKVRVFGPRTLLPPYCETLGAKVCASMDEAVSGADVIMMLRVQKERLDDVLFPSLREYAQRFCLSPRHLDQADSQVIVMHPGPMNRGVEISPEVADGPYSVILEQVENGGGGAHGPFVPVDRPGGLVERFLLKNGRILCPGTNRDETGDLLVENGKIEAMGPGLNPGDAQVIDCSGLLITPGLIDLHVHLREPGQEYKETVASGTAAAAAGGFTAVACMPNTTPVNDCRAVTEQILDQAAKAGKARVYPIGSITKGLKGAQLSEMAELKDAGCIGVSDDGKPVPSSRLLRRAMEYADTFGLTIICHSEDMDLAGKGVMHEGPCSTRLGLRGIPAESEIIGVERDLRLAELTGCRTHICHVSCAGSVEAIARAKERGAPVTCETAPHYLSLIDESVGDYDTNAKMNPPLRSQADREAVRAGLASGVIDAVATDHAPHDALEKDVEFDLAANGVIGLETALGLVLELVEQKVISLARAIELLSWGPARALRLAGGRLKAGEPADITVINPSSPWVVDPSRFKSKSRNTPFGGRTLPGRAVLTVCGGRITHKEL